MSEDDYNERLLMAHLDEQDTYDELIEEEKELILSNLVVGDVEDFEFVEQLFDVEDDLVEALAKNENDKAIGILRRVFDNQILSIAKDTVDNM
jgi:hypothetical protein